MTKRDIGQEILQSIQAVKRGQGKKTNIDFPKDVVSIRRGLHLSQDAFASLMGVSVRTLQEWEQRRRHPSGPAYSLLRIAKKHPEAFVDLRNDGAQSRSLSRSKK